MQKDSLLVSHITSQREINPPMRTTLVDWLAELQIKLKLDSNVLFRAVKLTDQFLNVCEVRREYLQLVGVTCFLIASKMVCLCLCNVMKYKDVLSPYRIVNESDLA